MKKGRLLGTLVLGISLLVLAACELFDVPDLDVGMEDAIAVVTQNVLPDAVPEGASFVCLRLADALPPGSVIEEDAPSSQSGPRSLGPTALTLGEESYLFFLDLEPGAFFEHDVKYIIVSKNGGYQVMDARWWPKVDGVVPKPFNAEIPDPDHIIAGNVDLDEPSGLAMTFDFSLFLQAREGFIVVQGLMWTENLFSCATNTYLNGLGFFNAYKSPSSEVEGLTQDQAADVLTEIDNMVADKLNPITIYIIAHGGVDGIRLGGEWFTAQQFRDKMAEHPATQFNFLLGSCHSGSFIDDLNTLDNMRVIKTACAADETAYPDWDSHDGQTDHNPRDNGSEWTSSLLRAAKLIVESPDSWSMIQSMASGQQVPVTSVLLDVAGHGALGNYSTLDLELDFDLSHRTGYATPQSWRSWFVFRPVVPIVPAY